MTVRNILDHNAPVKRKYICADDDPFLTKELRIATTQCSTLKSKHNRCNTDESCNQCKQQRNKCV